MRTRQKGGAVAPGRPDDNDLTSVKDELAVEVDHLKAALETRELIGQAQGLLMEREHISAEAAFDIMRRASQRTNRKLREIAADVVMQHASDSGPTSAHHQTQRDYAADLRDEMASERDAAANVRDVIADEREHLADERETWLNEREQRLDAAAKELGLMPTGWSEDQSNDEERQRSLAATLRAAAGMTRENRRHERDAEETARKELKRQRVDPDT